MSGPSRKRSDYPSIQPIQTRWMDNDVYGHVNNVVYYSYFDTLVNRFLTAEGLLSLTDSSVIGLVVETQCRYFASIAFPEALEGGLSVAKLGNSSVRYELAIFKAGEDDPVAEGHFVHVYVDRETRRPVPLPHRHREVLATLIPADQ